VSPEKSKADNYRSINVLTFNIFGVINWQLRWYRFKV